MEDVFVEPLLNKGNLGRTKEDTLLLQIDFPSTDKQILDIKVVLD